MKNIEKINNLYHGVTLEIYKSQEKPTISLDLGKKIRNKIENEFVLTGDLSGSPYFIPSETLSIPPEIITLPHKIFKKLNPTPKEGMERMFFIVPQKFIKKLNYTPFIDKFI